MKLLRKVIFWCHLLTGTIAGLVVLTMSVTGVLLTYERQIIAWADTRDYRLRPPAPPARLPVEALVAKVREAQPEAAPATITLRSDPAQPVAFGLAGGRNLFVNPYTGEVLGEGAPKVRRFFRAVTDWHRWLGAEGENRAVARAVTGACNLGFLFLVMSGFYLWWPRKWSWQSVRNVMWFRRGLAGKARDFNWHNVIGLWSAVPLFIVVLSATVISYTWASNLVYRLAGEAPPAPRAGTNQPAPNTQRRGEATPGAGAQSGAGTQSSVSSPAEAARAGLDQLWPRAEQQVSGWESITLRLPAAADTSVVFTIDRGDGGQPQKRAQLTLDRRTGEVVRWEPFSSYTLGRRLRSFLRFAHTGEVAGIVGQTVAGLASAGGAVLVWTGLALVWRRFRSWAAGRSGGRVQTSSQYTNGTAERNGPDPESRLISESGAN